MNRSNRARAFIALAAICIVSLSIALKNSDNDRFPCELDTHKLDAWSACMTKKFKGRPSSALESVITKSNFKLVGETRPGVFHYIRYANNLSSGAISIFVQIRGSDNTVSAVDHKPIRPVLEGNSAEDHD